MVLLELRPASQPVAAKSEHAQKTGGRREHHRQRNTPRGLRLLGGGSGCGQSVWRPQEVVCDASRLPEAAEQGAMHGGGVVADGVLAGEVQPWFDVLPQADGCGQQVVVIACNNRP